MNFEMSIHGLIFLSLSDELPNIIEFLEKEIIKYDSGMAKQKTVLKIAS